MKTYAKTPTIFQMEATECGAASLSMIFAYFGRHIPLEQMRIETGVSRDGCNAGNIMRAAKKYGLECHGYRKEPKDLKKLTPPCIIHWNFNHFVVFEGFKGDKAIINDPALGRRRLSMQELDDSFTGIVMTFATTPAFVKEKKKSDLQSFIGARFSGDYGVVAKMLFVGFLLVFPGLAFPVLCQVFMDDVLAGGKISWFGKIILFMTASVLLQAGLTAYRSRLMTSLQKKKALISSRDFLMRMFRLPISFFDQRYAGDLAGRVSDNNSINEFLIGDSAETILNFLVIIFYLVLLVAYSPVLAAIAVGSVLINIIITRVISSQLSELSIKLRQDSGKLSGAVCAGLGITSTLKASGAETEYIERILGYSAKSSVLEQRFSRVQQLANALPAAVRMAADMAVLLVGGSQVIEGRLTVGQLVAFTALFGSFYAPAEKLVGFVKKFQTTKADISRVQDIMKYPEAEKYSDKNEKADIHTKLEGRVEIKGISFGYSRLKPPIVEDFSFKVPCGSSVAFVGASGCGKSTVSKIISGLYEPWDGTVLFDDIPMKQIPNEVISASVSTVSQDITLFSGTIRDNLTMWNSKVSEEDMIAAAKDACIHDIITQKPGAYDYKLSEGASNLSGGQRQRLEIARALVLNPTVLIMDEATSALDPIVEKQIIDNIKRRGCTCIIVAHRLSAIRDCDEILVMEKGHIIQRGTHEELSAQNGLYRRFINNYGGGTAES